MSQSYSVVFSRFSTFYVTFLLTVCLAFPVNDLFKRIPSESLRYPHYYNKLFHHLHQSRDFKSYTSSTPPPQPKYASDESVSNEVTMIDQEYGTSCGKITCHSIKDYPTDIIEREFSEKFGDRLPPVQFRYDNGEPYEEIKSEFRGSEEVLETDNFNNYLNIKEVKADYPSQETNIPSDDVTKTEANVNIKIPFLASSSMSGMMRTLSTNNRIKSEERAVGGYDFLNTKRLRCHEQNEMTFPQEALNNNYEPVLLVNTPSYRIKTLECKAQKYCEDYLTPDNHIYKCESKIEKVTLETYNSIDKTFRNQTVLVTNGCDCRLVRTDVEY